MSVITTKPGCVACGKEIVVLKCENCFRTVCNTQSVVHSTDTNIQSDEARVDHQTLTEETENSKQQHALLQQVDDWECNSINKIRETAEEARQLILKHITQHVSQIEEKLFKLADQLRQPPQSNFVSKNVSQRQEEFAKLSKQLVTPSNITVRHVSTPIVTKIHVDIPALVCIPSISANAKWIQNGTTVAGGNGSGNERNQLDYPHGLYVDDDQTIYVTDYSNHRIVEWKSGAITGQVVAGGNGPGNESNQLNGPVDVVIDKETDSLIICNWGNGRVVRWPRQNGAGGETIISGIACAGLTMDSYGYLYVSDFFKHDVKRWKMGDPNGIVVAGGNGAGNGFDQLNNPTGIFVDQDHSVYVADYSNHRVMKWIEGAKEGIVVAGGQGQGSGLTQLYNPREIVVDQLGTVYVADQSNHRVVRWHPGATQGSVIAGGNGSGGQPNQFSNNCLDLSFDRQNNLYVSDHGNYRVQKFSIDPSSN